MFSPDTNEVKDKYLLIYILFYGLGTVSELPSSFYSTATDYWMYKFRDPNSTESYSSRNRTGLQADFNSDNSIVSTVGNVAFIIFTIHVLRARISIIKRAMGSFCGIVGLLILTSVFVKIDTDPWQQKFFVITLVISFFLNGLSGLFMVTIFEIAAKFPPGTIAALFSGQAICGIFAALVQIFALGVTDSPTTTGLIFFLIGMVVVLVTMVAFMAAWKESNYFDYYVHKQVEVRRPNFNKELIRSAVNKVKFYMLGMFFVLSATIMIHPGVTSLVVSMDEGNGNKWNDTFFVPVVSFFFYNLFDYLGRETATLLKRPTNDILVMILSLCRVPLVPLLIFCNAQPRENTSAVFGDAAYIIFIILFAYSNGYLVNLCILQVPKVTSNEERPLAMLSILLLMVLSLAISSSTSNAVVNGL